MGEKIPMEGVNVSPKMARVSVSVSSSGGDLTTDFLHPLAQDRINMNLLITREGKEGYCVLCCVAAADEGRTRRLIDSNPDLRKRAEVRESVGLVSIFPIRSSLKTVGLALIALFEARVPVYGFCSSLSALTFVIDHDRLDEALAAFEGCFGFPGERPAERQHQTL
jgi:aspartokinase